MNKIKVISNIFIIILFLLFKISFSDEEKSGKMLCEISPSPDFSKLAIRVFDKTTKENTMYLMALNKRGILKKIVSGKTSICYFSWDNKGEKIYYRKGWTICVYDLTTNKEDIIFKPEKEEFIGLVSCSPDRKYIGFSLVNLELPLSKKNVWIIDIDTREKRQITKDGLLYWGSWCWKSENEILYSKENEKGIFEINILTLEEKKVLDDFILYSVVLECISPDKKILFVSDLSRDNYYMVSLSDKRILYSSDNKLIASSVWELESKKVAFWKQIDSAWQLLIGELTDGEIKINKIDKIIRRPFPGEKTIEWLSPTKLLISGSEKTLEILDLSNMKIKRILMLR